MAHQLLIGKGMITLNLKRIFLALTLLPLFAVAADDCALSDPTLTVVMGHPTRAPRRIRSAAGIKKAARRQPVR